MPKYEKETILNRDYFDADLQIKPDAVLSVFQDVASDHVNYYGVGQPDLIGQGLLWVVTQIRFEICGSLKPEQQVRLVTWSLKPRHFMVQREYEITDGEGRPLIIGCAHWILMDMHTRKIASKLDEVMKDFQHEDKTHFPKRSGSLRAFEKPDEGYLIIPEASDIDFNDHVNNARYAAYMMAALPADHKPLKHFIINYHKELRIGEAFRLYIREDDGGFTAEGYGEETDALIFLGLAAF